MRQIGTPPAEGRDLLLAFAEDGSPSTPRTSEPSASITFPMLKPGGSFRRIAARPSAGTRPDFHRDRRAAGLRRGSSPDDDRQSTRADRRARSSFRGRTSRRPRAGWDSARARASSVPLTARRTCDGWLMSGRDERRSSDELAPASRKSRARCSRSRSGRCGACPAD